MKKFRKIYVEITNICNKKCSFCPDTKRAKAFMTSTQFEHIAKEIINYTDYVYLHVKGEPLLHTELQNILSICNKYNLKANISTNGILLKEKEIILKNAQIRQLNVSLHSFEDENMESFKKYIDNTLNVCKGLSKEGIIIRLKLWNDTLQNKARNEVILNKIKEVFGMQVLNETLVKDKKISNNVFLSIKKPFIWPNKNSKVVSDGKCYGLRNQIAILVDGTVTACCVDNDGDINLGNIFKTSLQDILNSHKALEIKKGFEDNKCVEELCKKCEYRKYL